MRAGALQDAEQNVPHAHANEDTDIFLLVRQWMASPDLSQQPLLVAPTAFKSAALHFVHRLCESPALLVPKCDEDRKAELNKLADLLEGTYGAVYRRGIDFIRTIVAGGHVQEMLPPIQFLKLGPRFDQRRSFHTECGWCFARPPNVRVAD